MSKSKNKRRALSQKKRDAERNDKSNQPDGPPPSIASPPKELKIEMEQPQLTNSSQQLKTSASASVSTETLPGPHDGADDSKSESIIGSLWGSTPLWAIAGFLLASYFANLSFKSKFIVTWLAFAIDVVQISLRKRKKGQSLWNGYAKQGILVIFGGSAGLWALYSFGPPPSEGSHVEQRISAEISARFEALSKPLLAMVSSFSKAKDSPSPISPRAEASSTSVSSDQQAEMLRRRTRQLANEIADFARVREVDRSRFVSTALAEWVSKNMGKQPVQREKNPRERLAEWNQETKARFDEEFGQRINDAAAELGGVGLDTTPLTRAYALANQVDIPRAISFRLSNLAACLGGPRPCSRTVTQMEANEIASNTPGNVEVFAYGADNNSIKVGEQLRAAFMQRALDEKVLPLPTRSPMPSGIHVIYPYADVAQMDKMLPLLQLAELEAYGEVSEPAPHIQNGKLHASAQIRIEVWPSTDRAGQELEEGRLGFK